MTEEWESAPDNAPDTCKCVSPLVVTRAYTKRNHSIYISREETYYTGCPRRKGPNFGRVFLRSNYTDITQNIYTQSSMVTEILAREKCGLLW